MDAIDLHDKMQKSRHDKKPKTKNFKKFENKNPIYVCFVFMYFHVFIVS